MKLSIDTTSNTAIKLGLDNVMKKIQVLSPRDQDLLQEINHFLDEQKATLSDLTQITVNPGPGRFTSLRTALSVAQALSFALNIPINNQPAGSTIEAEYGSEPNISTPKNF